MKSDAQPTTIVCGFITVSARHCNLMLLLVTRIGLRMKISARTQTDPSSSKSREILILSVLIRLFDLGHRRLLDMLDNHSTSGYNRSPQRCTSVENLTSLVLCICSRANAQLGT